MVEDVAAQAEKIRKAARQLRRLYRSPGITIATSDAVSRHRNDHSNAVVALLDAGQRELVRLLTEEDKILNTMGHKSVGTERADLVCRLRMCRTHILAIIDSVEESI